MNKIAVSILVSQMDDGTVRISSLAADDAISKAIERMQCEQVELLLRYLKSATDAHDAVTEAKV